MWILSQIEDHRVTNNHGNGLLDRRLLGGGRVWWSSDRLIPHKQHSFSLTYYLAHWIHSTHSTTSTTPETFLLHYFKHKAERNTQRNTRKFGVRWIFYNFWFICTLRMFLSVCVCCFGFRALWDDTFMFVWHYITKINGLLRYTVLLKRGIWNV